MRRKLRVAVAVAVAVAVVEKTRFFANRIAQTELARAHQTKKGAEFMADATIDVVAVKINPMQPKRDICDLHARADLYGLGPGNYPKARAPRPSFYPHCWCKLSSRPSLTGKPRKQVEGCEAAYLRAMPLAHAAQVMGSRERAEAVLNGGSVAGVVNAGKDSAYRLVRLGDGAAGHALVTPAQSPAVTAAPTKSEIVAFASTAASVADRLVLLNIGKVSNAAAIQAATGFDLTGFDRIVDNYGIRHTMKQHGSPSKEAARGQIAVKLEDFAMIPLITADPDAVTHDGKNKIGRDVLVFTKLIDGVGYRHVEEIRANRRLVATDSLRKKKGPWGP